ncbi:MAG: response regulator [Burkholderiaceae bacterium]|nr:response regulator [Burkholderiaceae bacterium]
MSAGMRAAGVSLTLRLLAILLVILGVVMACFALAARVVIDNARQQQLLDARAYFSSRIHNLDEGWRLNAFALRQLIELWQAGAGDATPALRDARLRTLLLTLTDQQDFTHVLIVDGAGRLRFGHGTRSQDLPPLPAATDARGLGWVFSEPDHTVYRTVSGTVRDAGEDHRLLLYFPIDNALLSRMVYPNARLVLLRGGTALAVSGAAESASEPHAQAGSVTTLAWDDRPEAPQLQVHRPFVSPLSGPQLLGLAAGGALAFVLAGWWVLGRWVRSQARRLHTLQQAATGFAAAPALSADIGQRLAGAGGQGDDIGLLAQALRDMMARIEQGRQDQARAQASLAALNAGLEDRVSERTRELEIARDEALAAARAKEQFLSSMSHEIRTPMNGMLGALELLSMTPLDERQSRYLEVAATSGEALMAVLNEVLDFAKLGAGALQLRHEPIELIAIAQSVATLFAAAAQRKQLVLRVQADPALAGWRLGDALRLRQVLLNLVGNAIKFTERGEIVLRLAPADGDGVRFEVSDTGPGIAAAQHELVFEPFSQVEAPGQRPAGGTGLGLAISRQLVCSLGGELGLHSAPGLGSRFGFTLPLPRAPAPRPPPPAAPTVPEAAMAGQVLLVEDNEVNRLIGSAMLQSLGLTVLTADDGAQAIALLARPPAPDLKAVLMDCQMPVMNGYQATRQLRELEREQQRTRLPVIALTANASSADVERCFAAGMDGHLAKPFTLEQLQAMLATWMAARNG